MSDNYDNTNTGALFINKDKFKLKDERDTTNWASMQGKINVYGIDFYISSWTKIIKSGENKGDKMQSLSIKPVNEDEGEQLAQLIKSGIQRGGSPPASKDKKLSSKDNLNDLDDIDDDLPF